MIRSFLREEEIPQFDKTVLLDKKKEEEEDLCKRPSFLCKKQKTYPKLVEPRYQTFNIKHKKKLSLNAKRILLAWNSNLTAKRPFHYANEDILYLLKSNLIEQDFLLKTLHSMAIFLQNATCANFADIFIDSVTITPENMDQKSNDSDFVESITFKLEYFVTLPPEKTESTW
jgi:hypothetical protein